MTQVVYFLAALWSVSCIILPLWGTFECWRCEEYGMAAGIFGLGLPLGAVMAVLPWVFIQDSQSPDLAVLKKGQWACTATRLETTLMPISTGKSTILVPTTHSVCITYSAVRS